MLCHRSSACGRLLAFSCQPAAFTTVRKPVSLLRSPTLCLCATSRYGSIARRVSNYTLVSPLATGLWVGVVGSLLYYWWSKKQAQQTKPRPAAAGYEQKQFSGKIVLITGAAGDIGGATAEAFARKGATVVLVDLQHCSDLLKERCAYLESIGAEKALNFITDMTVPEQVQNMVQFVLQSVGRIDCFFNNAGLQGELRPLHMYSDNNFQRVMEVNVFGVFLGMKYISKAMMDQGQGGVIINTSSVAGLLGPSNMVAYAASKFAVNGMTKTSAKDLARYGIRVCAVAPGLVEGSMWSSQVEGKIKCNKIIAEDKSEVTKREIIEMEKQMIEGTPMRRLGKLSEIASVVTYLCSDDASYITGSVVTIDGGRFP